VLDVAADAEILAIGLNGTAIITLEAAGYRVVQRDSIGVLDTTLTRLAVPDGRTLEAARAEIAAAGATVEAELNHFYRTRAAAVEAAVESCDGIQCAAFEQINWRPGSVSSCTQGTVIGMVDTGVNEAHAVFAGRDFSTLDLSMPGMAASGQSHGTAVASILIGDAAGRVPGLVPDARLIAADVFHREGSDERADAFALIRAMDALAEQGARVINMSLAGPHNPLVEIMARELDANGVTLVAAAGNEGPKAPPAFPAAYDGVIAVTAVDASGRVFRRANQGAYVDIAAPGVGVWAAASVRGARQQTGTSFAAPFVTAAVAATRDDGSASIDAKLFAAAKDLGEPGRDPVFGAGLVQASQPCVR
jgi:subtilisin family serine protease